MTNYAEMIHALAAQQVKFIIIGGAAAIAHGGSRLTEDLDIIYLRSRENIKQLVSALEPLKPRLRGTPEGVPFQWDEQTITNGLNFTLTTSAGSLDIFGEVPQGVRFEDLIADSQSLKIFGRQCLCLKLHRLIEVKQAAGRPKDLGAIAELKALLEEQNAS